MVVMIRRMQCVNCGGRLEGAMTFCPYCGVRQDIDLRQIHFRDLGCDGTLRCPSCESGLSVIEFETDPAIRVERCHSCHGMFFNPGELQALLDVQTNPLVWLDTVQMQRIASDYGFTHEVVYRKCPMCEDRMSHVNFASRSGVILDRCGTHGLWVEGGELRRLTEWWRAGGRLVFQQDEADKTKRLFAEKPPPMSHVPGSVESPDVIRDRTWSNSGGSPDVPAWLTALGALGSIIID
jgi:Zn-finger nucleic acid-binding protein